jgi:Kef-type K+ transport system membrane component KefB
VAAAKLAGALANRIGQPSVFGEILAGLILGPTVLNVLGWPLFATSEPGPPGHPSSDLLGVVHDFADVGVILLMFVAGLETDLAEMRRVGKVAFWSAFGGVILPMAAGIGTAVLFGLPLYWEAIFVGTILTATSVSITAQTLMELGALRSREGATILGAAVIDDVMGIVVLSFVVALARASGSLDLGAVAIVVLRMAGYFALAIAAGRLLGPALRWASRLPVTQAVLSAALVMAFVYAWGAEYAGGVAAITGAYIAGVLLGQTPFKQQIDAGLHPLTYSIFVPLFFVGIGLKANGRELGNRALFTVVLAVVAIAAKMLGSGVFARLSGFTTTEAVRVGAGMISRGEVGLIVAGYGLAHGLIGPQVFSAAVVTVLVTTMVTPPLLRATFPARPFAGDATVEETVGHVPRGRR